MCNVIVHPRDFQSGPICAKTVLALADEGKRMTNIAVNDSMFWVLLTMALIFDFLNGIHDSSNVVATVISSRAMRPRQVLLLAALAHFAGPFLLGVAVATTLGDGLFDPSALETEVVVAGLISAVIWNLVTWYFGLPSSSSHALVGGLIGSSILSAGLFAIKLSGLLKVLLALLLSPVLGLLAGYLALRITLWLVRNATPKVNALFRRMQIFTLIGLSLSHGSNDGQKTMGVITLGLLLAGRIDTFHVPLWVIAASASAMALGTSLGGWRLIRTLGGRIFRIRPVHGFCAQIAGAAVIMGAGWVGGPVSTTQVMSSAIMGVGASERLSKVRWTMLRDLALAWLLTIPTTAVLGAIALLVLSRIVGS